MSEAPSLTAFDRRPEAAPARRVDFTLGQIDFAVPTDPVLDQALSPGTPLFETLRVLRTRIETRSDGPRGRCLGVVSASPGEGSSLIALSLAVTLARDGVGSILLVDAALRAPAVESRLGLSSGAGLSDWLLEGGDKPAPLRRVEPFGLFVLPGGRPCAEPAPLLESPSFTRLLETARTTFDLVMVDCTPLTPYADSVLIQDRVDGFLLAVRARWAGRARILEAVARLKADRIHGLLLNDHQDLLRRRLSPGTERRG